MIHRAATFFRTVARNLKRRDDLPRFLTYTVTFGCNARCIMCDSWKMPNDDDLSLEEVERIFDQLPRMDAVRLTGGEPFARKDLTEIAVAAEKKLKPLAIHITTNGFLTDRIVQLCEDKRRNVPLDLLISIDGVGDKHNEIRGHSQAYDMCMKTIAALADRRKELRLSLAVNQTIVDAEGAEHYAKLREQLRPFNVHNHAVIAYDTSATYNLERDIDVAPKQVGEFTTFGEFSKEQMRDLLDEVERDIENYPLLKRWAKRYYVQGIRNRLLGDDITPNPKCVALNTHLRIFPTGDVPTCQFNSGIVGNLRRQSFTEVWESAKADAARDWVRKCPGCWAECEVLPSAIYTLDLLKHNLTAPRPTKPPAPKPVAEPVGAPEAVLAGELESR